MMVGTGVPVATQKNTSCRGLLITPVTLLGTTVKVGGTGCVVEGGECTVVEGEGGQCTVVVR